MNTTMKTRKNLISAKWQLPALACILLFANVAISHADVTLKGTVGAKTIDDNVVIASNTSAVLRKTIIKGNVLVKQGAKLVAIGAKVDGNIQSEGGTLIDLKASTQVEGDVQGKKTRTIKVRGSTFIGGNVQVQEAVAPKKVHALIVNSATVDGDIQAEKGAGIIKVLNSSAEGNLQIVENKRGPYTASNNRIKGDLQFFKNQGNGSIIGNRIGGNLQVKENTPRPLVKNNIVEGDTEVE